MRAGSISPNAPAAKKLAVLRQTRAQKSKMAGFNAKTKDEGSIQQPNAALKVDQQLAKGSGPAKLGGKVSKGGGAGPAEQPIYREHIDGEAKAPPWKGSPKTSAKNNVKTPPGIKKAPPKTGGMYGGGGRDTQ